MVRLLLLPRPAVVELAVRLIEDKDADAVLVVGVAVPDLGAGGCTKNPEDQGRGVHRGTGPTIQARTAAAERHGVVVPVDHCGDLKLLHVSHSFLFLGCWRACLSRERRQSARLSQGGVGERPNNDR